MKVLARKTEIDAAKKFVRKSGFKVTKIHPTAHYFRFRQRPPAQFTRTSFRTIPVTKKISFVIGRPKGSHVTKIQSVLYKRRK